MNATVIPNAMGFYSQDGFVTAQAHARRFAGPTGRIATMPDIVDARLADARGGYAWSWYFDTASFEFFGYTRGGVRALIVAHGIGPLATVEGQLASCDYVPANPDRGKKGGRISQEEFLKLESGHYGEVAVVPYDSVLSFAEFPFTYMRASVAALHPLVRARLGARYDEYLKQHASIATAHHLRSSGEVVTDPYIVSLRAPSDARYHTGGWREYPLAFPDLDAGNGALAHTLMMEQLVNLGHQSGYRSPSLTSEISVCNPGEGRRYIAVREGPLTTVRREIGGDTVGVLMNHPERLSDSVDVTTCDLYRLMKNSRGRWFTQVAHEGHAMATGVPEFMVEDVVPVGEVQRIVIDVEGYYGFFRFDYERIKQSMPEGSNAFDFVSVAVADSDHHECYVQFYRAAVDTSKRLWSLERLASDYDTLIDLMQKAA